MTIRAVLFDFDGTLRISTPRGRDVFLQYLHELGHAVDAHRKTIAARWEHYYWASSAEIRADMQKFGVDEGDAFYENYSRRQLVALGFSLEQAQQLAPQVHEMMKNGYSHENWIPGELPDVLNQLKETGYRLGVVSNRSRPYHEAVAETGLHLHFDFVLAAGEVDSYKPDVKIFQHAAQMANCAPHEALYVGDNYFADVVGARRAGMTPVLYDPEGIFDDPNCAVITHFSQLHGLLGGTHGLGN
jgi:HAD superfamily hydrolase (TIGR01549 family)